MGREKRKKLWYALPFKIQEREQAVKWYRSMLPMRKKYRGFAALRRFSCRRVKKGSYAWQFQQMICRGMTAYPGGCASDRACIGFLPEQTVVPNV